MSDILPVIENDVGGLSTGTSAQGGSGFVAVADLAQAVGQVKSTLDKVPTGSFAATGAAIGVGFGGVGAFVLGGVGALVDLYKLAGRPATELVGWGRAIGYCSGVADKVAADLKSNLTADEFRSLHNVIEQRAIDLIRTLEKNLTEPRVIEARVLRYINDITSLRGSYPTDYDCIQATITRFLVQRVEYFAVGDVETKLGQETVYRLNILVYDWLHEKGYISLSEGVPSIPGVNAPVSSAAGIGGVLSGMSDTVKLILFFVFAGIAVSVIGGKKP